MKTLPNIEPKGPMGLSDLEQLSEVKIEMIGTYNRKLSTQTWKAFVHGINTVSEATGEIQVPSGFAATPTKALERLAEELSNQVIVVKEQPVPYSRTPPGQKYYRLQKIFVD
jgi:hypothetical protein